MQEMNIWYKIWILLRQSFFKHYLIILWYKNNFCMSLCKVGHQYESYKPKLILHNFQCLLSIPNFNQDFVDLENVGLVMEK
jgi:hypothetical protein